GPDALGGARGLGVERALEEEVEPGAEEREGEGDGRGDRGRDEDGARRSREDPEVPGEDEAEERADGEEEGLDREPLRARRLDLGAGDQDEERELAPAE